MSAKWYVVRTEPRAESQAARALNLEGIEIYLPKIHSPRHRQRQGDLPLFPGYLFAGMTLGDVKRFHRVRWTPGVVRILGVNGEPTPMPREEITSLRILIAGGNDLNVVPFVMPGNRVRVKDGPIAGTEGTVVRFGNKNRLVITVSLLQSSVAVEIDGYMVEKISER